MFSFKIVISYVLDVSLSNMNFFLLDTTNGWSFKLLIIIINKMQHNFIKNLSILTILAIFFTSCSKEKFNFPSTKDVPTKGIDRARKNVEEGRGVTLGGLARGPRTTYEFSTSNPLWRASLEILDFIPMSTVDYSGGMII